MKSSRVLSAALIFVLVMLSSCTAIKRITRPANGTEFTIQVLTNEASKQEIYDKTFKILVSKINAIGLDADVSKVADTPDQLHVVVYGDQPLDPIRQTLFTVYRLEMKKVVTTIGEPATYPSEQAATAVLGQGQQILPVKTYDNKPKFLIVESPVILNGDDIRKASSSERDGSNYSILFSLKPEGAEKFGAWTERNVGNYLAIILNDEVQSYPVIKGKITDEGTIEGRFTKSSADDVALDLNAGYLPATIKIISERHIGS